MARHVGCTLVAMAADGDEREASCCPACTSRSCGRSSAAPTRAAGRGGAPPASVARAALWGGAADRGAAGRHGRLPLGGGGRDDVGELLVQLLWNAPGRGGRPQGAALYPLCAERARRALLHLLALKGLTPRPWRWSVSCIDLDGHWDLLPVPTADLLTPLLEAPGVERLAHPLVLVAWRRGWSAHVADLLNGMLRRELLTTIPRVAVAAGLAPAGRRPARHVQPVHRGARRTAGT